MDAIREIDPAEAAERLAAGDATFMDVRDPGSFEAAHVPGAVHVNDPDVERFVSEADPERTVIVYCYHGNASLGGAAFLMERGFESVYSLRGGFEAWRRDHAVASGRSG